jgi:hypothetical protein
MTLENNQRAKSVLHLEFESGKVQMHVTHITVLTKFEFYGNTEVMEEKYRFHSEDGHNNLLRTVGRQTDSV